MKTLYIGDPHATVDALKEMYSLIDFIEDVIITTKPDNVVLLGDQYHTHAVIHLGVMTFWSDAFRQLMTAGQSQDPPVDIKQPNVYAMVGNHDMSGVSNSRETSMSAHAFMVKVLSDPKVIQGILYVPYQADNQKFVDICNKYPTKTVVCHQSFAGAAFDNGFYDPHGIDPNLIVQEQIISGHIHKPQSFGKVWYPGAPRWRTVGDANTQRAIWLVEHDEEGRIVSQKAFDTSACCRSIHLLEDRPGSPAVIPTGNVSVIVDIYGPKEHVALRKDELEQSGARVRTFPDTEKIIKVKESDGIAVAFKSFVDNHKTKNGTPPTSIWEMAKERVTWLKQG